MKKVLKIGAVFCLSMSLLGAGQLMEYEWSDHVQMPLDFSKEKQREVASCVVNEISAPDFKARLVSMFPNVSKERIQRVVIRVVDGSRVFDYPGKGIEI